MDKKVAKYPEFGCTSEQWNEAMSKAKDSNKVERAVLTNRAKVIYQVMNSNKDGDE